MNLPDIPRNYLLVGGFLVLFGVVALLFAFLEFLTRIYSNSIFHKEGQGFGIKVRNSIVYLLFLLFFPLFLLWMIIAARPYYQEKLRLNGILTKLIESLLVLGVLLPIWVGTYYGIGMGTTQLVRYKLGYYEDPIRIAGTGSMYPTFPKGTGKTIEEQTKEIVDIAKMNPYPDGFVFQGVRYGRYQIGRGDIVSFENAKTDELTTRTTGEAAGFVKRIIGLPGDSLELRDGLVYLNGKPLSENYTAKAHSTFGGDNLPDCKTLQVPENELFVMGDNRKGSLDSRFTLGLISYNDIDHVIPFEKQKGILDKNWRDTSGDLSNATKIRLDRTGYLALINQKRKELGIPPLKYQPKLQKTAEQRAAAMFKANEVSVDVATNGFTRDEVFASSGYIHYATGELPTQGYFEADELFENQAEFIKTKDFFLKDIYQEIGIAEVEGEINGCPTQIIVQHLAGYVPPTYRKEDLEGFTSALQRVKEVQPAWADLKNNVSFYTQNKADVDRINEIINIRIVHVQAIVNRIQANEWLTSQEEGFVDQEPSLYNEEQEIAKRLNEKIHQGI
jgi:signal peptidase I